MIIFYGYRSYGKIDRVTGLFYVVTEFFHLNWVPLIPVRTYLVVEGRDVDGRRAGVPIRLSLKSILVTWLRAGSVLLFASGVVMMIAELEDRWRRRQPFAMDWIGVDAVLLGGPIFLWFFASWLARASRQRMLHLAQLLGIPPERIRTGGDHPPADPASVSDTFDRYVSDVESSQPTDNRTPPLG